MTWFKVDDSFYDHPKVFDAPDSAVALWVRAGTWSARNSQGGFVPTKMPARLCDDPEAAVRELLDRGLWKRTKGGYRFHDWEIYQPTQEEAIAAQQKQSSGGRLGNHRRWHVERGVRDPQCLWCADRSDADPTGGPIDTDGASAIARTNGSTQSVRANRQVSGTHRSGTRSGTRIGGESGANPPSRPVPSRRDRDGSVGGHLQVADARASRGLDWIQDRYGLSAGDAERVMDTIAKNSREPVKDWPRLIDHMAGNGTLAPIVERFQRPGPPPVAEPVRRTVTGCDIHPNGAVDPLAPDDWGQCLFCNDRRRRAQRNRKTA